MGHADASAFSRLGRPVLLIDSRRWDRAAVAQAVTRAGFLPRTAASPQRALAQLARPEEDVEAVLVPERLDGVSLGDFASEIGALRPGLPVIATAPDEVGAALRRRPLPHA